MINCETIPHRLQQQLLFWQSRHVISLKLGFHHQFIETQVQSGNPNLNEITLHVVHVKDTFIYNQLYQLLNKLNNLRHEILSITIIRKYIYFIIYVSCFRSFIYLS
jgi:hypothetical protein